MAHDAKAQRGERPFVFTNLKTGEGLDAVIASSASGDALTGATWVITQANGCPVGVDAPGEVTRASPATRFSPAAPENSESGIF
jgi:hypothetical protein